MGKEKKNRLEINLKNKNELKQSIYRLYIIYDYFNIFLPLFCASYCIGLSKNKY